MTLSVHGTGRLQRLNVVNLTRFIDPDKNAPLFLLGSNVSPGESGLPWSPLQDVAIGEPVEVNGERTENPDWGTAWMPKHAPGMGLTIGYAGSGKGNLLIPALLTYGGSVVTNDPKGELAWITAPQRRRIGHKVCICDPFGEVQKGYGDKVGEVEHATRYNPLAALHPGSSDFPERIATAGEALAIDKSGGGDNRLFSGTARDMIEGVLAAEATLHPGSARLRDVRAWLTLPAPGFAAAVTAYLEEHSKGLAASKLRGFTDMDNRTNQSTLITAKEMTTFLDNEAIVSYFEPEPGEATFSFDELADGRLTVYVVLPGRLLGAYSGFSRLMFNQALEAVQRVRRENLDKPVTFLIDEAGTAIGRLDSVEQAYGLARGAGMVVWSFYQDLAQLKRDYPKSWNTFVSNSACVTVTGARDAETCDYFSNYLGTKTITITSQGTSVGSGPGGASSGSSTNTSIAGVPVLHPEQIRTMNPNFLLCLMPSTAGNFLQNKLVYFRDPRFNGMYRPDPKYGTALPAPTYPKGPYTKPPLKEAPTEEPKASGGGFRVALAVAVFFVIVPVFNTMLSALRLGAFGVLIQVVINLAVLGWCVKTVWSWVAARNKRPPNRTGQWYIYRKHETAGGEPWVVGSIAGWPERQTL